HFGHQMGVEAAPGLGSGRSLAPGKCDRLESSQALVGAEVGEQKLAPPQGSVVARRHSSEDDPQHRQTARRLAVLDQAGGDLSALAQDAWLANGAKV